MTDVENVATAKVTMIEVKDAFDIGFFALHRTQGVLQLRVLFTGEISGYNSNVRA